MLLLLVCVFFGPAWLRSQTQFSNSSASLHYSYRSEPADRVTPRQYSWYIKVPFATITRDTLTLIHVHTLTYNTYARMCMHMRGGYDEASGGGEQGMDEGTVTRERCRRLQEVTKPS